MQLTASNSIQQNLTFILFLKILLLFQGTVSIILSDPPFIEGHVRSLTAPFTQICPFSKSKFNLYEA